MGWADRPQGCVPASLFSLDACSSELNAALHVDGLDPNDVMRRLELLPDREGDVDLLLAFGADPDAGHQDGARPAEPLLVRAELLAQPDDRLIEVAEHLRTDFIEAR